MMNFMIFGDIAVNMAMVISMHQQSDGSVRMLLSSGENALLENTTIDDILTAQAAGQARIAAFAKINAAKTQQEITNPVRNALEPPKPSFSQRRSSRFREPMQNDPQAMKSIGRR